MADRIHDLLKKKGIGQRDLANLLGKNESEISKWITGTHNFTLRTLSAIESVLGSDVCIAAGKETHKTETKIIYVYTSPSPITAKKLPSLVSVKAQFNILESAFSLKSNALA